MIRVYIDFDSTLFDTSQILKMVNKLIAEGVCENVKGIDLKTVLNEVNFAQENGEFSVFNRCEFFEKKYGIENGALRVKIDRLLESGKDLLYGDSIEFLKKLSKKGYEINLLTYSIKENFDYQLLKVMGSGVIDYVDNVIVCSKQKGELSLDFENGYFIDDNPAELVSLFKAGVSKDRIFRIKREGAGYSNLKITEFIAKEYNNLDEIDI